MPDREKVIKALTDALTAKENYPSARAEMSFEFIEMLLELLKKQEAQKFFVDKSGKITPLPVVVRCKDCTHRPIKPNDYENGFDLEFPDNKCPCQNGDDGWYSWYPADNWYCAEGERRVST